MYLYIRLIDEFYKKGYKFQKINLDFWFTDLLQKLINSIHTNQSAIYEIWCGYDK